MEPEVPDIRVPQARVLKGLMPSDPEADPFDWPCYTRSALNKRMGYSPLSGTINRAMRGIAKKCSSGDAYPGLLQIGCVEILEFDIDGLSETNYKITPLGVAAYQRWVELNGDSLPALKDAATCTNKRYVESQD